MLKYDINMTLFVRLKVCALERRLYGICPEVLVLLFTTSKYKLLVANATLIVYSLYKPSKSRAAYFYLVLSRT